MPVASAFARWAAVRPPERAVLRAVERVLRALEFAERRCRVAAAFFAAALRWAVVRRRGVLRRVLDWVAIWYFASSPLVRGNSGLLVLMRIELYQRTGVRQSPRL